MNALFIYKLLQEACCLLEQGGETAIAAHVSHCMAMVQATHGVGRDHLDDGD